MKKIVTTLLILTLTFQFSSCKTEEKKITVKKEVATAAFSLDKANNSINWVAYKTTDKIAVKGEFKKVNITKNGNGNTAKDAINNAEFSIPVSSIFSNLDDRDYKLRKFFFGVMDNTSLVSGKLMLKDETKGVASITMNGVTADLPFTYTLEGKVFNLNATMNLDHWNAQNAVKSLNEICKDLHKAADGISKTWSEVDINITSTFK
ncbi:YceI family protein [Polaribacter gochangensis]|uniref:YceI family protein n=1 Tax=Polaribacter gochangensis TaxID=3252903 RepID=UPI003904C47B